MKEEKKESKRLKEEARIRMLNLEIKNIKEKIYNNHQEIENHTLTIEEVEKKNKWLEEEILDMENKIHHLTIYDDDFLIKQRQYLKIITDFKKILST